MCSLNALNKGKHYCWNPVAILWISLYRHVQCNTSYQVIVYYLVRKDLMTQWYINLKLTLILVERYDKKVSVKKWVTFGLYIVTRGLSVLRIFVMWPPICPSGIYQSFWLISLGMCAYVFINNKYCLNEKHCFWKMNWRDVRKGDGKQYPEQNYMNFKKKNMKRG